MGMHSQVPLGVVGQGLAAMDRQKGNRGRTGTRKWLGRDETGSNEYTLEHEVLACLSPKFGLRKGALLSDTSCALVLLASTFI